MAPENFQFLLEQSKCFDLLEDLQRNGHQEIYQRVENLISTYLPISNDIEDNCYWFHLLNYFLSTLNFMFFQ